MSNKYNDPNGDFVDPVVRCDSCAKIILGTELRSIGMCPNCGNKKVREVRNIKEDEMVELKELNIDPEWLALFEPVTPDKGAIAND